MDPIQSLSPSNLSITCFQSYHEQDNLDKVIPKLKDLKKWYSALRGQYSDMYHKTFGRVYRLVSLLTIAVRQLFKQYKYASR